MVYSSGGITPGVGQPLQRCHCKAWPRELGCWGLRRREYQEGQTGTVTSDQGSQAVPQFPHVTFLTGLQLSMGSRTACSPREDVLALHSKAQFPPSGFHRNRDFPPCWLFSGILESSKRPSFLINRPLK